MKPSCACPYTHKYMHVHVNVHVYIYVHVCIDATFWNRSWRSDSLLSIIANAGGTAFRRIVISSGKGHCRRGAPLLAPVGVGLRPPRFDFLSSSCVCPTPISRCSCYGRGIIVQILTLAAGGAITWVQIPSTRKKTLRCHSLGLAMSTTPTRFQVI